MDNIFRFLRRNSKQILSLMLAFVVFVENPLTAFASPTTNESSNISKPVVDDDSPENFDPDTYTGEPFYFDENGNRVYDSENEELLKIREEIKEELGIDINEDEVKLFKTYKYDDAFKDVFYIKKDIDINSLTYQEDEVEYVKYLTKDEILNLINNNGNIRKTNIDAFLDIIN